MIYFKEVFPMVALIFSILVTGFLLLFAITTITHIFFAAPYVPSKYSVVKRMVSEAHLKPHDTVFDLGCGDGRLLLAAENERKKIRAVGFEVAPLIYFLALFKKWVFRSKMVIRFRNFFNGNLREADVIFCYLLPEAMQKLSRKIKKECRRGTRIISNTFHLPGFKPVKILKKNPKLGLPTIYVYRA